MSFEIALEPKKFEEYEKAINLGGGVVTGLRSDSKALVWTDYSRPDLLESHLSKRNSLEWVQLPFAGVDAFTRIISKYPRITFTSAKRSYAEPVAEHALMLCMALGRAIPERVRAKEWGEKFAQTLFDENLLIVGGGGIAQKLVELLEPFRTRVVVIRKRPAETFTNSLFSSVSGFEELDQELPRAKFVVIACALTDETRFLFSAKRFELMRNDAYLVNVARGEVVNQDELVNALRTGEIAGAATDVTYPEPLPVGHEMWSIQNLIITPHTADTPKIVKRLFAKRLEENVNAWISGVKLVGIVDPTLGY